MSKSYLGDGVYVDFDGFGLVLTTEDGLRATNTIVLEPEVYESLVTYAAVLQRSFKGTKADAVDPSGDSNTGTPTPRA